MTDLTKEQRKLISEFIETPLWGAVSQFIITRAHEQCSLDQVDLQAPDDVLARTVHANVVAKNAIIDILSELESAGTVSNDSNGVKMLR